jgi:hypothetical protein
LEIGSFASGDRELTGNIDDVRIYDHVLSQAEMDLLATGPPPPDDGPKLSIAPSAGSGYDLTWTSKVGKIYDLVSHTDLSIAPENWEVYDPDGPGGVDPYGAIPSDGDTTTLTDVPGSGARRFFAIVEMDAPPLFSADFEADNGSFIFSTGEGSDWEWGVPDSSNGVDLTITAGNGGSANCWATDLGTTGDGTYMTPTTTYLRSAPIDLSAVPGAVLRFAEAVDFSTTDSAEVYVIDDTTDTLVDPAPIHISSTGSVRTAEWADANGGTPIVLPAAAIDQSVRIEWRFTGTSNGYLGWHIDDVAVSAAAAP